MKAEWVNAVAALAAVLVALYGVWVAKKQLGGLREALRTDSLMAVLTIESELAGRQETCSEISMLIRRLNAQKNFDQVEMGILKSRLAEAVESWLNALERLCFCINKGYVTEKGWRAEYRKYIEDAISSHEPLFRADTRYPNTLHIHKKWQAE
jgi:hypothetical protein